jgi:hypothetical protein
MTRDQVLLQAWGFGCLIVGPALILAGARGAGSAVIGSLVGAFVGLLVSPNFDSLPYAGAFRGGLERGARDSGVDQDRDAEVLGD